MSPVPVLNAFRHQRKEHVGLVCRADLMLLVLNAFRHQRKEHGAICKPIDNAIPCSTPFGINGRNTSRSVHAHAKHVVLNAFRHQRKEHETDTAWKNRLKSCSTPFGINGRNTIAKHCPKYAVSSAQRLSASTEGTPDRRGPGGAQRDVLNAFRHQRKEHPIGGRPGGARRECSTPFGINGRNTGRMAGQVVLHSGCSTPFGINGRNTCLEIDYYARLRCAQRLSASTEGTLGTRDIW